jgi:hypothetical protein
MVITTNHVRRKGYGGSFTRAMLTAIPRRNRAERKRFNEGRRGMVLYGVRSPTMLKENNTLAV